MVVSTDTLGWVCLLWDIDGTLITHAPAKRDRHAHAVALALGVDAHPVVAGTGKTDRQIVVEIIAVHDEPADALVDAALEHLDRITEDDLRSEPAEPIDGVGDVLRGLGRTGVLNRLLTGNTPRRAELKVDSAGLGEHFDPQAGFYGHVHATRFDLVAQAATELGPDEIPRTVIVGDTPLDIAAARSAGFPVISVATGTVSAAELASHRPDALLSDFSGGVAAFLAAVRLAIGDGSERAQAVT